MIYLFVLKFLFTTIVVLDCLIIFLTQFALWHWIFFKIKIGSFPVLSLQTLLIFYIIIVSFAAACMTWELAESGKHFITTIINGSDLVPTFSTSSIDDLRSEVCWLGL